MQQTGKPISTSFLVLMISLIAVSVGEPGAAKSRKPDGGNTFKQSCASCHPAGGNLVNSKKPVAGSKMLSTAAVFKQYLESPTGHMPHYKHIVTDSAILNALYKYCKTLKTPQAGA